MIDKLALVMAEHVKRKAPSHPASIPVMKHALAILINMGAIIIVTLAVSAVLGTLRQAIIAMLTFAILRQITGGYHLKSSVTCIAVSSAMLIGTSVLHISTPFTVILTIVSALLCAIYSPSRIENQSRIPKKYYPWLRIGGTALVLVNLIVLSDTVAIAAFIQSLLLIRTRR